MHYISLGYFCSVALELEKLGLRTKSAPFDWVISDFQGVVFAMQHRFAGFLEYENLAQNKVDRTHYKDKKYNIEFYHDFEAYTPLKTQLRRVRQKYNRRIERFFATITEPTLFIRYISDEEQVDGVSAELRWIEQHYDMILETLKSFNEHNEILFIANEGVTSETIVIYNVSKDENDVVARNPISDHPQLLEIFSRVPFPNKEANIRQHIQKQQREKHRRARQARIALLKKWFSKEYIHPIQY